MFLGQCRGVPSTSPPPKLGALPSGLCPPPVDVVIASIPIVEASECSSSLSLCLGSLSVCSWQRTEIKWCTHTFIPWKRTGDTFLKGIEQGTRPLRKFWYKLPVVTSRTLKCPQLFLVGWSDIILQGLNPSFRNTNHTITYLVS